MGISFEPVKGYLIRAGEHHRQIGDQYRVSAIADIEDGKAEIKGVDRRITRDEYRATIRGLRKLGVSEIVRKRHRGDMVLEKEIGMKEPLSVAVAVTDSDGNPVFECKWHQMGKKNLAELELAMMKGVSELTQAQAAE